jgi:hypothetical protein
MERDPGVGSTEHVRPVGLDCDRRNEPVESFGERIRHEGTPSKRSLSAACAAFRVAATVPGAMPRTDAMPS